MIYRAVLEAHRVCGDQHEGTGVGGLAAEVSVAGVPGASGQIVGESAKAGVDDVVGQQLPPGLGGLHVDVEQRFGPR